MTARRKTTSWTTLAVMLLGSISLLAGAASALEITRPSPNEVLYGNRIVVEGTAGRQARVRLIIQREERKLIGSNWVTIYDQTKRASQRGRWDGTTSAGDKDGVYRAVARVLNSRGQVISEAVRVFRVDTGGFGGSGGSTGNRFVSIDRPTSGAVFKDPVVLISGTASRNMRVRLHVYGPGGRLVSDQTINIGSNGRWSDSIRLSSEGGYSAYADLKDSRGNTLVRDSVAFRLDYEGGFGGSGGSNLYFTTPKSGQTISNPLVTVAGRSLARREVRIQVFGPGGSRIHYEMTRADGDGHWSVRVSLTRVGEYQARAELLDDRGRVTATASLSFRYGRWGGGSGDGNLGPASLIITHPTDGQRLYNVVYGFQGKANPGHDVRIQVWDAQGRRVFGYSTRVAGDGGWYLTVRIPGRGRYRADVESMARSGEITARRAVHFVYGTN